MKLNRRYLLVEIDKKQEEAKDEIKNALKNFLGVFGVSRLGLKFIKIDEKKEKSIIILSINCRELDSVRAAFCLDKAQILVRKVSGTIKKLKEKDL
jgi:RNase P/RNase MRP subunit POP5